MNELNKSPAFLIGQTLTQLESYAVSLGCQRFRGRQLFDWLYSKQVDDYDKMSNLSYNFREQLKGIPIHPLKIINENISRTKKTQKYLFQLSSGKLIESVLMKEGKRVTACLSTQVGCAVGCGFCATAKMGFIQNLTSGEILDQYLHLQKISEYKITNIVFMGMGEPFLNYDNTIESANLLHHPEGINMGAWRITISTAGIIRKINQYTREGHPYKLAVSLNASNELQRLKTMPITKSNSFKELINSSKNYTLQTKKKITFEYVMLSNINDSLSDARALVRQLGSINCKLNLIPYNEIDGDFKRPSNEKIDNFLKILAHAPFPVTIRWSKGQEIDAGCGQLAIIHE